MTVFGHPVLGAWIGDPATEAALGWDAEIAAYLRFWIALAEAQEAAGVVPDGTATALRSGLVAPPPGELRAGMRRDGVVVPGLLAILRRTMPDGIARHLHHGATSQDVIDTALMLRAKSILADHAERLDALARRLDAMSDRWGDAPLMAVTRMRDALPIRVGDRIAGWRSGIGGAAARCREVRAGLPVQLGGPVGTLEAPGTAGPSIRAGLAERLGLVDPGRAWHADRWPVLEIARAAADAARATGKVGLDVCLMAQDGVAAITLTGGRSSAMAHKVNPVDAELLVALARHAGALEGAVGGAGPHELERSGSAWTAEWLALPDLMLTAGGAITATERLLGSVSHMGTTG